MIAMGEKRILWIRFQIKNNILSLKKNKKKSLYTQKSFCFFFLFSSSFQGQAKRTLKTHFSTSLLGLTRFKNPPTLPWCPQPSEAYCSSPAPTTRVCFYFWRESYKFVISFFFAEDFQVIGAKFESFKLYTISIRTIGSIVME